MLRVDSKLYLYSEVADTMLPGKVSKLQYTGIVPETDTGGQVE